MKNWKAIEALIHVGDENPFEMDSEDRIDWLEEQLSWALTELEKSRRTVETLDNQIVDILNSKTEQNHV